VNVAGDTVVEPDETFTVTLSAPTGSTLGTAAATATILNDDAPPTADAVDRGDDAERGGGQRGDDAVHLHVTRSGNLSGASSASYAVTGGTATAADFAGGVLPSGTVSFVAGQATATITVNVAGDTVVEPDETFTVTLSAPTGSTLGTAAATATILNDDAPPPPTLSIAATTLSAAEGNAGTTPFTFTVTRSGDLSGASSASYAVTGGTATAADFAGGVLAVGDGVVRGRPGDGDDHGERGGRHGGGADETFTVTLSAPTGSTLGTAAATATILNDDAPPPPTLSIARRR